MMIRLTQAPLTISPPGSSADPFGHEALVPTDYKQTQVGDRASPLTTDNAPLIYAAPGHTLAGVAKQRDEDRAPSLFAAPGPMPCGVIYQRNDDR
jgi:hypothetical protein